MHPRWRINSSITRSWRLRLLKRLLWSSEVWLSWLSRSSGCNLCMGNMSNPSVNRWGSNLIWYNFWYTDYNYSRLVSQDRIFVQLVNTYIQYGLNTTRSHFSNHYWFNKSRSELKPYTNTYFWIFTAHKVQIGRKYHLMRYKRDDVFNMRTWVLRYGDWLLINIYWFRPHKKKITSRMFSWCFDRDYLTVTPNTGSRSLRRVLTLLNNHNVTFTNSFLDYKF